MKKHLLSLIIVGLLQTNLTAQTWTIQVSGTNEDLSSINFPDSCIGWAFGTAGVILKTTSRGGSWDAQTTSPDFDINASYFFNTNNGIAVGHNIGTGNGFSIVTNNGGLTWNSDVTFAERLRDVHFANANIGWTVGFNGYVVKTVDGGSVWAVQNSGTGNNLFGVYFTDPNNGWAVGVGGEIINTADGGFTTWNAQTSGTGEDLNAVFFVNPSLGWTVGNAGTILGTTDGGTNWNAQNSGTGEDLLDVVFVNDSTGWVVGTGGTVLMTTDSGNTWNSQTSGTGEDIFSITMLSSNLGWYCGTAGTIGYYGNTPVPSADFSFSGTCLGNTTTFTDLSLGNPTSWSWIFGDGNTSILQNPTNVYSIVGSYNVSLTISNATGCTDTINKTVIITSVPPVANFTASTTTACVGIPVDFTDLSTNIPTSWTWDFGDGNADNIQNPANTYLTPGTYTVTLIVNNGCGSDVMIQNNYITVIANILNADFTFDTVCAGTPTSFTDLSTGGATIWSWDYNDGSPLDTVQNPTHIFDAGGNYIVDLTIFDGSCESTISGLVLVKDKPVADFSSTVACLGDTSFFTDLSGGAPVSWSWNFGDGSPIDTNQNPSHVYASGGNFNVTLTVTNSLGCIDVITQITVVTTTPPVANFSALPITVCAGSPVDFTDLSTNNPTSWLWNFGDGNTSPGQNPANTYITPGTYSVTLVVTNGCGSDALVQNNLITVTANALNSAFTHDTACAGTPTTFTDLSTGGATVWSWDFNDGSPLDSTQNPMHLFASQGTYNVDLTITDGPCMSTITITVLVKRSPTANFTNTTVCLGNPTSFNDLSTPGGGGTTLTGWSWDFGDGSPADTNQNPSHSYASGGNYNVTFVVTNSVGCTDTLTQTVTVNAANIAVTPSAPVICAPGDSVTLTASGGTIYIWSPAAGLSATTGSTVFAFPSATTTYTVVGTASNGCTDSTTVTITIDSITPPNANFTADITSGCGSLTVNFTNSSTITTGILWSFPGGNPSTSIIENPTVSYSVSGTYDVELIATGCTINDTLIMTGLITVYPDVVASFSVSIDPVNLAISGNVTFTDASTSASSWSWDFGDGTGTSTLQDPTYTYTTVGNYTIRLIVTDGGICSDSTFYTITVINVSGIKDLSTTNSISIYPNPANDWINVENNNFIKSWGLIIYDYTGKIILEQSQIRKKQITVNMNNFPAGFYILKAINSNGEVYVSKIILE